jgi:hypothetical protein
MFKKITILSMAAVLVSCGGSTTTPPAAEVKADTVKPAKEEMPANDLADFKFSVMVTNIPSPFEIISLLPKAGCPFKIELANPVENVSKYNTSTKKALNYGGYVVDLIYISTNEQFGQVKPYFKTAHALAQALDCAESFEKIAGKRMEQNMDKKDTINKIIDQLYSEMDTYLRSNDRLLAATQIVVGSWIESQFITVSLIKDAEKTKQNEVLFERISLQKPTLDKLADLLVEFEKEKDMKFVTDAIKDLQTLYKAETSGSNISKETLAKIYEKLNAVRTKMNG